ncbi:MAG: site-specific DNA-methyltransferase [Deltaproteobacteria bacterium]|nr:site-specific DNA-methyltransferase [Deltaproteobacteria bacterium]
MGDNLEVMASLSAAGLAKSAMLIYIDPPFLSGVDYSKRSGKGKKQFAYTDKFSREGYLEMLRPRLTLMHTLLADTGKIFVHCDWRASHLIRTLLDEIFGAENFLNEIVWHYGGRGAKAVSGQFARNHDSIYAYGKTKRAKLKKLYIERKMTLKEAAALGYRADEKGRVFKTAPRGDYTDKSIATLEKQGRVHTTKNGKVRIKYFLEKRGNLFVEKIPVGDVWSDIPDAMHMPLKERTGYPTQKPETLLRRIIECSTDEGDLVMDFFAGSGTTASAATALKRKWIIADSSPVAAKTASRRLKARNSGL